MKDILPEGEALRKALRWIGDRRQGDESTPVYKLIEEASMRFNLSPSDAEFLGRLVKGGDKET